MGMLDQLAAMGGPPQYTPLPQQAINAMAQNHALDVLAANAANAGQGALQSGAQGQAMQALAMSTGADIAGNILPAIKAAYDEAIGRQSALDNAVYARLLGAGNEDSQRLSAMLQAAGQVTDPTDKLAQIGRGTAGATYARGSAAMSNLIAQAAAANQYAAGLPGWTTQAGMQAARSQSGAGAMQARQAQYNRMADQANAAAAKDAGAMWDAEQARQASLVKADQSQRQFIAKMAWDALKDARAGKRTARQDAYRQYIDAQRFNEQVREFGVRENRYNTQFNQRQAAQAQKAAEAAAKAAKAGKQNWRDALSSMSGQAQTWAAQIAKGKTVKRPKKIRGTNRVIPGKYETVTVPYKWAEAMKLLTGKLSAKYAVEMKQYKIKTTRVATIARSALMAEGMSP